MTRKLALIARDAEDLEVISTILQDAVVPVAEMTFVAAENRFVLVASRFSRESGEEAPKGVFERVSCAVRFDRVSAVKRQNLDPARLSGVLSLLAIRREAGYIDLVFSGGGTIRLIADEIACRIDDLDLRWPTRLKPDHPES
ncbi:MAG: DUF2948 family protein [Defluviicoccus sp.]|nr:DUF2948 family protein [Defluviicoccus sp.]MDE0275141.1 DUF2948 family protein [Defluviicoccus sp.]